MPSQQKLNEMLRSGNHLEIIEWFQENQSLLEAHNVPERLDTLKKRVVSAYQIEGLDSELELGSLEGELQILIDSVHFEPQEEHMQSSAKLEFINIWSTMRWKRISAFVIGAIGLLSGIATLSELSWGSDKKDEVTNQEINKVETHGSDSEVIITDGDVNLNKSNLETQKDSIVSKKD